MAGTLTWDLDGCHLSIERQEISAVKIQTAESQTEIRTAWSDAPRYRYAFQITARTGAATNEVDSIRSLYASNGMRDSFTMEDPLDSVSVTARFDSPLSMRRVLAGGATGAWWELSFSVITVVDPT